MGKPDITCLLSFEKCLIDVRNLYRTEKCQVMDSLSSLAIFNWCFFISKCLYKEIATKVQADSKDRKIKKARLGSNVSLKKSSECIF